MSITRLAIEKNRITYAVIAMLTLAGMMSYLSLPKNQDPGFTIRVAVVSTRFEGASALRVEQLVTDRIEQKVQEMPELDKVTSISMNGMSVVYAEFKDRYTEMRPIFDDLRRKIDQLQGELPDGAGAPVVNDEYGDVFGTVYTLRGDGFSYAELKDFADDIRDRLLKQADIAKVDIYGDQDERIFVEYSNARLTELGISPRQLASALSAVNILASGGSLVAGHERITLEPTGNFESVEDLQRTVISLPGSGELVYLGDIADIKRGYVDPPSSFVRAGGAPALAIAMSMREGGNILELGRVVKALMPELEQQYPYGIYLEPVAFLAGKVESSVNDFLKNLLQAVGIVLAIMFLFLGFRTGIVVSLLIPTAMLITFYLMQLLDIGIDQMSLAALIIALGLLVDNAIVMTESILVKMEGGMGAVDAASSSGSELLMPLLVSSLTTAAAFMPIALAEGAIGEYTASIFYVVSLTLLSSWVIAMTLVPAVATRVLHPPQVDEGHRFDGRFYRLYHQLLNLSLRHRLIFVVLVIGCFYLAMLGLGLVPKVFIPDSTDPIITVKLELPTGTDIRHTREVVEDIEQYMTNTWLAGADTGRTHGIQSWVTYIGNGGPRFVLGYDPAAADPSNAQMVINATRFESVFPVMQGMEEYILRQHPDLDVQIKRLSNGPPVGYPVQIRVLGTQIAVLDSIVAGIKNKLYGMAKVSIVSDDWGPRSKKMLVNINQERALRAGVTSDDVAVALQTSLSGLTLSEFRQGDKNIPIALRSVEAERQDIGKLDGISVYSSSRGTAIPLKQVADTTLAWESALIRRSDRERVITINVQIMPGVTATEVGSELFPWLEQEASGWPHGYYYETGGESETSDEANASLAAALPLGGMAIVLLLIIQFNSFRRPAIILTTIPLGLIGVTIGLLATRDVFGFFTILGVVSLSGIIINNAIVMLDRIRLEIEDNGRTQQDAVLQACQQRLRPIMLTTATTIGGMLPLWLGGNVMFQTMAIAIIFGLLFSTLLTLLVVPVLYSLFFKVNFRQVID